MIAEQHEFETVGDELIETYREKSKNISRNETEKPVSELASSFEGKLSGDYPHADELIRQEKEREEKRKRYRIEQNINRLAVDVERFVVSTFDEYEIKTEAQQKVFNEVLNFSKSPWKANRNGLLLFGNVGTGKDHLITCAAREIVKQGVSIRYFIAEHFYQNCSDRFKSNQSEKDFIRKYVEPDVVIFSDPIKKKWLNSDPNDAGHERFCSIVKQRAQHQKPTWLTGNLFKASFEDGMRQLESIFGSDVVRRLTDNAVLCWCDWPCYTKAAKVVK